MIEEVVRQAEYLFDSLMRVQPATTPRWWEQTSQKGTEKGAAAKGSGKGPGKSAGKAKGKGSKRGYDAAFSYPQEAPGIFITGPWLTDPPPGYFTSGAVFHGKCRKCGLWGHMERDCPKTETVKAAAVKQED